MNYAINYSKKIKSLESSGAPGIFYSVDRSEDGGYYFLAAWN